MIALLFLIAAARADASAANVMRPKVVVVTFLEIGKDTGDVPGELQHWVENDRLTRVIQVPGMTHVVHANPSGSEIAVLIGLGEIRPAINVMALGLSRGRFLPYRPASRAHTNNPLCAAADVVRNETDDVPQGRCLERGIVYVRRLPCGCDMRERCFA